MQSIRHQQHYMDKKEESLVNKSGRRCMHLLMGTNFKAWIQLWQTWANLEVVPFIATSNYFSVDIKTQAKRLGGTDWAKFTMGQKGIPSIFKNIQGFFTNKNFWDPKNKAVTWDDRLWLGNSYLFLYMVFRDDKYLQVASELYKFILLCNADWRAVGYRGLQWKPETDYRKSITNQLFMVFCGRLYQITRDSNYLEALKAQYVLLFGQQGKYINSNQLSLFPESVEPGEFYTYAQGIALEGLAYLILYGDDYKLYMGQLSRLTTGIISHFRNKEHAKLIMRESLIEDSSLLRTSSIFRSFVFRQLIHTYRLLQPQMFKDYKARTPFLKTFVLDNAQAMCKYQNLSPCYNWQKYNDGVIHDYNAFNQFYVLLSAVQMFGINQLVVDGLMVPSDGTLVVETGPNIRGIYLSTFSFDSQGVYRRSERRLVSSGQIAFKDLLQQPLISRDNNRNIMEITALTVNNSQIPLTLVHIQGEASLFALVPDRLGQSIINNFVVRIRYKRGVRELQYISETGQCVTSLNLAVLSNLTPLMIKVI